MLLKSRSVSLCVRSFSSTAHTSTEAKRAKKSSRENKHEWQAKDATESEMDVKADRSPKKSIPSLERETEKLFKKDKQKK
ncbi:hypothetical protein DM01DRAFT_327090 [Hesseltinella vesiculosa]|uniref:Uncharacterized protein n=1 Tax=Hesseltinella vesiculosa TaxID=101127 RepID=A0A1X2GXV9_9FUNG|nr:hypothetical protein DM01DRAFT_327090 [Hesseltinella vesiculosa]